MNGRGHRRGGLGFGGAVGLGIAATLLIAVIAVGRAVFRQLTGAVSVVIVFAEITLCLLLAAGAVAVVGLLLYRGQLAKLHLDERRADVAQLERGPSWRAEVLDGRPVPEAIEAPRARVSAYPRIDAQPHVVTSDDDMRAQCPYEYCHHNHPELPPPWQRHHEEDDHDG